MVKALLIALLGIFALRGVLAGEEEYYRMITLPTPEGIPTHGQGSNRPTERAFSKIQI